MNSKNRLFLQKMLLDIKNKFGSNSKKYRYAIDSIKVVNNPTYLKVIYGFLMSKE